VRQELLAGMSIVKKLLVIKTSSWTWIDFLEEELMGVQDDVMHDWNNTPTQQHVQSFYMDETEVTNFM
jgi:hypothetical protein